MEISKTSKRIKPPIREFLGDKDAYKRFLDPQWEEADKFARENGYENLTLTRVPNAGPDAFPDQVIAFFTYLPPKRAVE